MRKIVIILPSFQQGGVQKALLEALKVIDLTRYNITLYFYSDTNAWLRYLPKEVKVIVDTDKTHYMRRPKGLVILTKKFFAKITHNKTSERKIEKEIQQYIHDNKAKYPAKKYFSKGVDVAVSYAMGLCTEMAVNIPAKKRYVFFHSSDPMFHRDISDKCFYKYDGIVAVGENVRIMLEKNFPVYKEKIKLIKNYLNQEDIIHQAAVKKINTVQYRKDYVFTSVVRVDKEKGVDLIVAAARILKTSGLSFVWFVVGDGSTRDLMEDQIKQNGLEDSVIITGFQDNPYPYISCCDIYVHPAYEESFGLSILEALILGKAVVSTDTMGAREVLDSGTLGMIVSVGADAIANGITQLIDDKDMREFYEAAYKDKNDDAKRVYKEKWTKLLNGDEI